MNSRLRPTGHLVFSPSTESLETAEVVKVSQFSLTSRVGQSDRRANSCFFSRGLHEAIKCLYVKTYTYPIRPIGNSRTTLDAHNGKLEIYLGRCGLPQLVAWQLLANENNNSNRQYGGPDSCLFATFRLNFAYRYFTYWIACFTTGRPPKVYCRSEQAHGCSVPGGSRNEHCGSCPAAPPWGGTKDSQSRIGRTLASG